MKHLAKAKQFLIMAAVVCICIKVVYWAIVPLLPYFIGGLIFVVVLGVILFRTTKL